MSPAEKAEHLSNEFAAARREQGVGAVNPVRLFSVYAELTARRVVTEVARIADAAERIAAALERSP